MNCSDTILLIVFIFVVAVVIGKYVKPHIFDEYEPQNMGSHKYWGFGRDYGYSIDDTLQRDNFVIKLLLIIIIVNLDIIDVQILIL